MRERIEHQHHASYQEVLKVEQDKKYKNINLTSYIRLHWGIAYLCKSLGR